MLLLGKAAIALSELHLLPPFTSFLLALSSLFLVLLPLLLLLLVVENEAGTAEARASFPVESLVQPLPSLPSLRGRSAALPATTASAATAAAAKRGIDHRGPFQLDHAALGQCRAANRTRAAVPTIIITTPIKTVALLLQPMKVVARGGRQRGGGKLEDVELLLLLRSKDRKSVV